MRELFGTDTQRECLRHHTSGTPSLRVPGRPIVRRGILFSSRAAAASRCVFLVWHGRQSNCRLSRAWLSPGDMWSTSVPGRPQRWPESSRTPWHTPPSRRITRARILCQFFGSRSRRLLVSQAISLLLSPAKAGPVFRCTDPAISRPGQSRQGLPPTIFIGASSSSRCCHSS